MTFVPEVEIILTYFADHGLQNGREYTLGGLRTHRALPDQPLMGIEEFGGRWRTYVALPDRKTGYSHWPTFQTAADAIIEMQSAKI